MNVHESLEYLENLDVSSEDDLASDDDFILVGKIGYFTSKRQG